jgi:hypothetical protein
VFGGKGDVGEVGGTVPGVDGIRTNACCADPTGECELIKVAFDFDARYVVAGCVDPALGLQGADLAAWLDAEGDGLELHLTPLTRLVSRRVPLAKRPTRSLAGPSRH